MKAILPKVPVSNGRNYADGKETVDTYNVVGLYRGVMVPVVTARAYMGRSAQASTVYASIWVSLGPRLSEDKQCVYFDNSTGGSGSAGGGGYHKVSAAIGDAIASAGIELYGDVYGKRYDYVDGQRVEQPENLKQRAYIGRVGDSAIKAALLAIGRAVLGSRAKLLVINN
jgi:hypothetical protein